MENPSSKRISARPLMPADFKEAYNGVLDAVKTGELTEERIDQSLTRILGLKLTLPRHKR